MIENILSAMSSALATDVNILSFCNENFGRDHNVFLGQEVDIPIDLSLLPAIVIYGIDAKQGNDQRRNMSIMVGIVISNAEKQTAGNLVSMTGLLQLEALAELVETCILSLPQKCEFVCVEYRSEIFPMFSTVRKFLFEVIWPLRC